MVDYPIHASFDNICSLLYDKFIKSPTSLLHCESGGFGLCVICAYRGVRLYSKIPHDEKKG
jgi:hypothetical protein